MKAESILRHGNVVSREVAGEVVILDLAGSVILGLNGTGGSVWRMLDGQRDLGSIAASLASDFGRAQDEVLDDVMAFAQVLVERKLASIH